MLLALVAFLDFVFTAKLLCYGELSCYRVNFVCYISKKMMQDLLIDHAQLSS
jgi:hypothetical protein